MFLILMKPSEMELNYIGKCFKKKEIYKQSFRMQNQASRSNKPQNYSKTPLEQRYILVDSVYNKKMSISKVSHDLGIKLSTAKLILKKFKEQGCFFERKEDRKTRMAALQQTMQMPSLPAVPLMIEPTPTISLVSVNYQNMINNPWNMPLSTSQIYWPLFCEIQAYNPYSIANGSLSAYYI